MINNFPSHLHLYDYSNRIEQSARRAGAFDGRPLPVRGSRFAALWLHKGRRSAAEQETTQEKDPRVALGA